MTRVCLGAVFMSVPLRAAAAAAKTGRPPVAAADSSAPLTVYSPRQSRGL